MIPVSEKSIPAAQLSDAEKSLLDRVEKNKDAIVELLKDLIAIDSRIYSAEQFCDQKKIFDFVENYMKKIGAKCERYSCPHPFRQSGTEQEWPSLVATIGQEKREKALQFCGHLDVVPFTAEKWATNPLSATVKDGKIFGRGASDMKGGVASSMIAIKLLAESGLPLEGSLRMLFFPDEEINCDYGSQFMASNHKDAINAPTIIAEPTGQPPLTSPALIIGEKGYAWLRLKFFGASGHGSMPRPRSNAINKATRFIAGSKMLGLPKVKPPMSLMNMLRQLLGRISFKTLIKIAKAPPVESPDPYNEDGLGIGNLFKTTISFNQIHAGTKINVIPDSCELEIDIRILPGITIQDVFDAIASYCTKLGFRLKLPDAYANLQAKNKRLEKRPVDVDLSIISTALGTFENLDQPVITLLKQAFEDVYGVKAVFFFAPGTSDAVSLRSVGIKDIVLFGPTGGHAHEANEFVEIDQLVSACKVYLLVAYRMLCKKI